MIVGNKCDKDLREVTKKEGEAFAKKMGTLFIETSAKTTVGVRDAFVEVVRKIIETPSLWQKSQQKPNSVPINQSNSTGGTSFCGC